jgi:hypothetical protein
MGAEITIMAEVAEGGDEDLGVRFRQLAVDLAGRAGNNDASTLTWVATDGRKVRDTFEHVGIADERRVYALEITGGEFGPGRHNPSGWPVLPSRAMTLFVDEDTLEPFLFGGGGVDPTDLSPLGETHVESLIGVSPTPRDHDLEATCRPAPAT